VQEKYSPKGGNTNFRLGAKKLLKSKPAKWSRSSKLGFQTEAANSSCMKTWRDVAVFPKNFTSMKKGVDKNHDFGEGDQEIFLWKPCIKKDLRILKRYVIGIPEKSLKKRSRQTSTSQGSRLFLDLKTQFEEKQTVPLHGVHRSRQNGNLHPVIQEVLGSAHRFFCFYRKIALTNSDRQPTKESIWAESEWECIIRSISDNERVESWNGS